MARMKLLVASGFAVAIHLGKSAIAATYILTSFEGNTDDDRPRIQSALDAVQADGGGVVRLTRGVYNIGPATAGQEPPITGDYSLKLGRNVHLQLDPDATIVRRFYGLDWQNATVRNRNDPPPDGPEQNIRVSGGTFTTLHEDNHGRHIAFYNADYVWVDNVRITAVYKEWNVNFKNCEHVAATRLFINSGQSLVEDGIHFTGGKHLLVDSCSIQCGDDCVAFNVDAAETDADNLSDAVVSNCTLQSYTANAVRLLVTAGRQQTISRVQISNIVAKTGPRPTMPDPQELPGGIHINDQNHNHQISDIMIDGVQLDASQNMNDGLWIEGAERVRLSRVVIRNPLYRTRIDNSRDVELIECTIESPRDLTPQPCVLVAGAGSCEDIRFRGGQYIDAAQHGIQLGSGPNSVTGFRLSGVQIKNAADAGLALANATSGIVEGCDISGGGWGIVETVGNSDHNIYLGNRLAGATAPLVIVGFNSRAIRNIAPLGIALVDTGGFRNTVDGWSRESVPASQSMADELVRNNQDPPTAGRFRTPQKGYVTGLIVTSTKAITQGSITVSVYRNAGDAGADLDPSMDIGVTATLNTTNPKEAIATAPEGVESFFEGDELFLVFTSTADLQPLDAAIRCAILYVQ
jgi:hypothetical protein